MNYKMTNILLHVFIVIICSFVWQQGSVFAQNVPTVPCPNSFEYISSNGGYAGRVTIRNAPLQTTKVEVQFIQREPITTGFNGRLSLFDGLQETELKLKNGIPITYRVDFPNSNIAPKLLSISLNDNDICTNTGIPPPSTTFKLQHTFFPSYTTTVPVPQNPPINTPIISKPIPTITQPVKIPQTTKTPTNVVNNIFLKPFLDSQTSTTQRPWTTTSRRPPSVDLKFKSDFACGKEGIGLQPFIVGGVDFPRGLFPWLTAIFVSQAADLRFRCGGSLISSRTVISAAHCFFEKNLPAERISVSLGRHDLLSVEQGMVQKSIASYKKHPQFEMDVLADADITLLFLKDAVIFSQLIRPICLWSQNSNTAIENAVVAGWGSDNTSPETSSTPKMVETRIVDTGECLRKSDINPAWTSSRTLCAGNGDSTGPCIGDSGGGLMVVQGKTWMIRGIVSGGLTVQGKCKTAYALYCDLSKHLPWVKENMLD